ncbi:hypothetical protein VTJ49DRAFT_4229 [Mycothermus thermophilus]|uniref:C2H2-type domain-containing protein n=1 Tax=Humicola insolens TaxID=85995 RepID=A0ABR3V5S6_HUMIN
MPCPIKSARILLVARNICRCFPLSLTSLDTMAECHYLSAKAAVPGRASGTVLSPPRHRAVCGRTRGASDSLELTAALQPDTEIYPSSPQSDNYTLDSPPRPLPANSSRYRWIADLAYRPRGAASFTPPGQPPAGGQGSHPERSGDRGPGDRHDGPEQTGDNGQDGFEGDNSGSDDDYDEAGDNDQNIPRQGLHYMCPFRSANPAHFNNRKYPACTTPFPGLSKVKEHIGKRHLIYACPLAPPDRLRNTRPPEERSVVSTSSVSPISTADTYPQVVGDSLNLQPTTQNGYNPRWQPPRESFPITNPTLLPCPPQQLNHASTEQRYSGGPSRSAPHQGNWYPNPQAGYSLPAQPQGNYYTGQQQGGEPLLHYRQQYHQQQQHHQQQQQQYLVPGNVNPGFDRAYRDLSYGQQSQGYRQRYGP